MWGIDRSSKTNSQGFPGQNQFAVGIATALGITVERCAPGAAILDGARAAFDGEISLIIHEDVGTPFKQAFLVAHEIGHAELGDGQEDDEPAAQIDPVRTSEACPVGMDRVFDYSRRQRREVQMADRKRIAHSSLNSQVIDFACDFGFSTSGKHPLVQARYMRTWQ